MVKAVPGRKKATVPGATSRVSWTVQTARLLRSDLDRIVLAASNGELSTDLVTDLRPAFDAIAQYGLDVEAGERFAGQPELSGEDAERGALGYIR
jgi:hypothetical protein